MGHSIDPDPRHDEWMRIALDEAAAATGGDDAHRRFVAGDVPIGAVVVQPSTDRVLARRRNERERAADPTAHAEMLALRDAAAVLGRRRLSDCLMVVTLEPCPMCAGALWAAQIGGVVQGAANTDAGSLGSLYHLGQDPRLNHEFPVRSGVLAQESSGLLQEFFADRRR